MNEHFVFRNESLPEIEKEIDKQLRPLDFNDFSGQSKIVDNLKVFVRAAKMRGEALDHVLLHGPPGLGKTTLSNIIANELGVSLKLISGPVLDKPGDLAGLLTKLEPNSVLFIDEMHRMNPQVEEFLYSAMEDYKIDIMIDKGPRARSIQVELNPFTLIGATTRSGLLNSSLRARFGIKAQLEYYDVDILTKIVKRSADILNVIIAEDAAFAIASKSHGTPRIVNALLRRVRDFAQVKGNGEINMDITMIALKAMHIDKYNLDELDNKLLLSLEESLKILLVEDNILNQRIVLFSLRKYKHQVTIANNGLEAIEKFKSSEYDVILMDIMMPFMDGLEATVKIREIEKLNKASKRTPIIALTSNTMDNDRNKCLSYGMDEFMSKPFDIEKLKLIFNKLAITG